MHHTLPRINFLLSATLCAAPALADGLTIAELAPPDAVTVIGVDDCKATFASFDETGFAAIWKDAQFQKWFEKHSKETLDDMAKGFEELGVKMEDLKRPVGAAGVAAWFTGATVEPGMPPPPPAVLMMADYADQAEAMHTTLVTMLEKAQAQKQAEYKETEHDGVTIYTYKLIKPEGEDPEVVDDEGEPIEFMGEEAPTYEQMHYARAENVLLVCSDLEFMQKTIDRVKGGKASSVSESETFQRALSQVGPHQGYAVIMGDVGREWMKKEMARDAEGGDPMAAAMTQLLGTLGLEQVQAIGSGFTFESDDAMAEISYAVLAPKKEGAVALFDAPEMPFDPPAFVGGDIASFTVMQANFPGILPLAERIVRDLPEDMKAMVEGQVMMAQQMMGPMLANLGPEMHILTKYERPLTIDSEKTVFAIKLRNQEAFTTALKGVVPMMGLEPRDFNGNQIYSPGAGGMIPADAFAMGLGFGHVFMGPTASVENMMRDAGAADAPKLSEEKGFKAAQRLTSGKGIAYSYQKSAEAADWQEWTMKNFDKIIDAQVKEMFPEEPADEQEREWRDQMIKEMRESTPAWMRDNPPFHLIRKHVGDNILEVRSTPEGFVGRGWILNPQ